MRLELRLGKRDSSEGSRIRVEGLGELTKPVVSGKAAVLTTLRQAERQ